MSCSIRVTTVRGLPISSSILIKFNMAMIEAVQLRTGFDPDTQMEVWWQEPLNADICFNVLPFNVDIILNRHNLDPEINLEQLAEDVSVEVCNAIASVGPLPFKLKLGVFCSIPIASHFHME